VISDSSIVTKWGIKPQNAHLDKQNSIQLHIMELAKHFEHIEFFHILRQQNKVADRLANIGVTLVPRTLE